MKEKKEETLDPSSPSFFLAAPLHLCAGSLQIAAFALCVVRPACWPRPEGQNKGAGGEQSHSLPLD